MIFNLCWIGVKRWQCCVQVTVVIADWPWVSTKESLTPPLMVIGHPLSLGRIVWATPLNNFRPCGEDRNIPCGNGMLWHSFRWPVAGCRPGTPLTHEPFLTQWLRWHTFVPRLSAVSLFGSLCCQCHLCAMRDVRQRSPSVRSSSALCPQLLTSSP